MRWRPEFIRCIGKLGDDFMVVLDIARVFAAAPHDEAGQDGSVPEQQAA
jgi:purine-binding chemotaxis protein CheW